MATMTLDDLVLEARRLLGKTDAAKGGADDATYERLVNRAIGDLCRDGRALKSVFLLSTKAGDKYVPLDDQILWVENIHYIPAQGLPYPMTLVSGAQFPTGPGQPRMWWWTAVNIPDEDGPSFRSLGISPYTAGDEANVLRVDAYQRAKDLAAGTDVPEIHELFHEAIAARAALYVLPQYRDKLYLADYLRGIWKEGVEAFKAFCSPGAKVVAQTSDVMSYSTRWRRT